MAKNYLDSLYADKDYGSNSFKHALAGCDINFS